MTKFSTKIKNEKLIVKARLSFNDEVNDRELEVFSVKYIKGLLKPEHIRKRLIQYSGPNAVSLYERLKKPITQYEFYNMVVQICECIKGVEKNRLFIDNLILDLRYVYMNENTKEVFFIYLPIVSNHVCVDVISFIESIVYSVKSEVSTDYISKFVNQLKSASKFDADEIEKYIAQQDKTMAAQIKKMNYGQSGFITDKPDVYIEHYGDSQDSPTTLLDGPSFDDNPDEETTLLDPDESTTLLNDDEGTTVLTEEAEDNNVHYPTLMRINTNETISVNKVVFRIGKERSYVDYFVADNHAISRSHADIVTRGNRYFILDHNSTNHTYVNGTMIPVEKETEISDGDIIKLANEEFEFHI
jgi:hypothetical protein